MNKKSDPLQLKKFYITLMIIVPSILLVIISMGIEVFLTRAIAQLIVFVFQYIIVKGVLDDYYST